MSESPKRWVETTLGELAEVIRGVTYKKEQAKDCPADGFLPLLRATNISQELDFDNLVYVPRRNVSDLQMLREGDVVIAASSGSKSVVGKGAVLKSAWTGTFGAFCAVSRPSEAIAARYLSCYLQTQEYRNYVSACSAGVNINNLKASDLESFALKLAPRGEQDRIVDEIEKQFTRLDAATAALKRVKANLKRYRASVLKAACEGRLVPTEAELARKEGCDYEPADKLLQRILRERRARWEADTLAKMQASGKPPKDNNWKQKYKEPSAPDTSDLPNLPEGWCWTSLGQAFEVCVGATPSRGISKYWNGSIPWVSSGEVAFCHIQSTRESITELGLRNTSTEVHPSGTVLIGMIGEGKTRGQVAILDIKACNNQNSAAIRVSRSGLPAEFVYRFLEGVYEQTRALSSGNNQPALNKARVQEIVIPLAPLQEQLRICMETERVLSATTHAEEACVDQLRRASILRNSILNRAFTGQLVPQDPTDEPASALLKRIRAERVESSKKNAARKTVRKRGMR